MPLKEQPVAPAPANRGRLLRLGGREFLLIAAMLLGLAGILVVVLGPDVQRAWAHHAIRQREAIYGFRTGNIPSTAVCPFTGMWGIVSVVREGVFAEAGVRAGDVPLFTHGGVGELAHALEQSETGRPASFEVFNCGDPNPQVRRVIQLPPTGSGRR